MNPDSLNIKNGKKVYKHKMHFCIFCKNEFSRLAEHFIRRHKNEDKVKEIMCIRDKKEKLWKWKRLRQQGDHLFNTSEKEGGRKIVKVPHRPSGKKKYFDCPVCLARLRTSSRAQHNNLCKNILKPNLELNFEETAEDIFNGLPEGLINKIRSNVYFISFLKQMFEARENKQILRTLSRDLISFDEEIKKLTGQKKPLTCFFTSTHVDDVIKTIRIMSGFVNVSKEKVLRYPYRAQRICRMINNFCKFLITSYSKRNMDWDVVEVTKFLNVFQSDAEKLIRRQAYRAIKIRNLKSPAKLPKTSHINVLVNRLKEETPKLMSSLELKKNPLNWRKLAENILCRLTIFNRRRGGAVEKMKVADYLATEVRLKTATEESTYNLSAEEREFLQDVRIVEILHKCDNVIPIFITKEIQEGMDILLKCRPFADINEKNEYFFAASKKSVNPISGVRVLEKYREFLPKDIKKLFTATNLRKHGATVAQVLDLTPQDKEEWAFHMGHSVSVHNKYYRKPEEVSAILKTGRILTAMDAGAMKFYKGKKISDIPLKPIKGPPPQDAEHKDSKIAHSAPPTQASTSEKLTAGPNTSGPLTIENILSEDTIPASTLQSDDKETDNFKDFYKKSPQKHEEEKQRKSNNSVLVQSAVQHENFARNHDNFYKPSTSKKQRKEMGSWESYPPREYSTRDYPKLEHSKSDYSKRAYSKRDYSELEYSKRKSDKYFEDAYIRSSRSMRKRKPKVRKILTYYSGSDSETYGSYDKPDFPEEFYHKKTFRDVPDYYEPVLKYKHKRIKAVAAYKRRPKKTYDSYSDEYSDNVSGILSLSENQRNGC